MKKVLAIVLTLVMVFGLVACGGGQQGGGDQPAETKVLKILMEDLNATDQVLACLDDFEAKTGIKVEAEVINYATMHDKLVTQLTASESDYDVLVVDCYWVGEFAEAGWMEPLDPYIEASGFDTSVYLPTMMEMVGELDGVTYELPFYNYMMALIYRPDVFADEGLHKAYQEKFGTDFTMPSEDLKEYVQIAEFTTEYFKSQGVEMYGAVHQAGRGDPIAIEFCNYMYSNGGDFYDANGNITVNNPEVVEALDLYTEAVEKASPAGAAGFNLDDAYAVYSSGKAASFVTYNTFMPVLDDPSQSQVVGLSEIANVPGGHALNGGWGWAIPHNAKDKDASWEFINYIESFEIAKRRAEGGSAPTRTDIFSDPDIMALYPYYDTVLEIMKDAIMLPIMPDSTPLMEIFGRELSEAVSGNKTSQEALDQVATEMKDLKR
ncbi:MAG: extracellular solute-binding protein [Clostridia bacterium]|nr:extracellular solute-binding protein [Bacillota bacterium]MCR4667781.1 extracellular solute-binding protein [Clostridia bacterium]